jgi:L-2-amino-thiazoline-4-carboxylic acid hydrolase
MYPGGVIFCYDKEKKSFFWLFSGEGYNDCKTRCREHRPCFANRAHIYRLLFSHLRSELGAERATELLGRAIFQRGLEKAAKYASFAPRDLDGLKEAFVANLPDNGAMFAPEIVRCDADGLDIKFHRCPLKQAWLDAGLTPNEVATLCQIAAQVDQGMFEAAGFHFQAETYAPGKEGCCFLHVRPGDVG